MDSIANEYYRSLGDKKPGIGKKELDSIRKKIDGLITRQYASLLAPERTEDAEDRLRKYYLEKLTHYVLNGNHAKRQSAKVWRE